MYGVTGPGLGSRSVAACWASTVLMTAAIAWPVQDWPSWSRTSNWPLPGRASMAGARGWSRGRYSRSRRSYTSGRALASNPLPPTVTLAGTLVFAMGGSLAAPAASPATRAGACLVGILAAGHLGNVLSAGSGDGLGSLRANPDRDDVRRLLLALQLGRPMLEARIEAGGGRRRGRHEDLAGLCGRCQAGGRVHRIAHGGQLRAVALADGAVPHRARVDPDP